MNWLVRILWVIVYIIFMLSILGIIFAEKYYLRMGYLIPFCLMYDILLRKYYYKKIKKEV